VPVMEEYTHNRPAKSKPSGLLNLLATSINVGACIGATHGLWCSPA